MIFGFRVPRRSAGRHLAPPPRHAHAVWRGPVVGVWLAVACLGGCDAKFSGPGLTTNFAQTASENYNLAQAEFADRDWEDAISYADFVRMRFPFSRHAVDAELLAARANYELKNYTAARDAFRQFGRMHPSHKHVRNGWTDYMAVVCAYMAVPPGTWPLPPDSQLDRSALDEAHDEILAFFDRHTGSPVEAFAQDLRERIEKRLLDHDLYVARYHLDRDHPDAAIVRLHAAHARFPDTKSAAEVLFLLGMTYLRMDEVELSRETFTELQTRHPQHANGQQAKAYLDYIYRTFGPPDPKRKRPERPLDTPKSPVHLKPGTVHYAKTVTTAPLVEEARKIERVRIEQDKAAREQALREATARGARPFTTPTPAIGESGKPAGSAPGTSPSTTGSGSPNNSSGVAPSEAATTTSTPAASPPATTSPASSTPTTPKPSEPASSSTSSPAATTPPKV